MNDSIPAAKIKMLNNSMRCFVYGLLSFIPVFGFPFAIGALWSSGRARATEKKFWNAARPYRIVGILCAAFGAIFWSGIVIIVAVRAVMIAEGLD
jgi:hypothetical protein